MSFTNSMSAFPDGSTDAIAACILSMLAVNSGHAESGPAPSACGRVSCRPAASATVGIKISRNPKRRRVLFIFDLFDQFREPVGARKISSVAERGGEHCGGE